MVPQFVRKLVRSVAATAFVLWAVAALAPSQAEASCGDYVTTRGHTAHSDHSQGAHDMPSQDPATPRCRGPHCSNGSFPPAAPAPRLVVTVEQWALAGDAAICLSPNSCSQLPETHEIPCDGAAQSILRPPR